MTFDKEKWRGELRAESFTGTVGILKALEIAERAYAEGRADGLEQGAKWVDGLYEDTRDAEGETFTVRSIQSTRDALRVALAAARRETP